MRKFLSIFTVTATLIGLAGCSQSEITEPVVDTNQPVEIKVAGKTLGITSHTRAPFDGNGAVAIDARVIVSSTSLDYTTRVANDIIKFAAGADSGFDPAVPYPHSTNSVYLIGLYPAGAVDDWTIASGSASFTFNGSHDVMATRQVETKRTDGTASPTTYPLMTFHHLLTRLDLRIQAENIAAQEAWGEVTSIKVKSPSTGVAVNFDIENNTRPNADFSTTVGEFPFYAIATDNVFPQTPLPLKTVNPGVQSYCLVAPKDGNGSQVKYDLLVTSENHTAEYPITVDLNDTSSAAFTGNTQGNKFEITLTFTATEIMAKATVVDWTTGGTGGGTIQ